jgi:NADPH:quinone reductase-like Zn-dependent oxidoreductase
MRAVRITRSGGPEVLDVVDLPDPVPADDHQLHDVSASGLNPADAPHRLTHTGSLARGSGDVAPTSIRHHARQLPGAALGRPAH